MSSRMISKEQEAELLAENHEQFGLCEPPQDYRIFNRRQPDGTFRPLSEFFDKAAKIIEAHYE